jgi:exonuclease I
MNRLFSECSDSAKIEIERQLDELKKHFGRDSSDILPKPEKIVTGIKNRRVEKENTSFRERLNATILDKFTKSTT